MVVPGSTQEDLNEVGPIEEIRRASQSDANRTWSPYGLGTKCENPQQILQRQDPSHPELPESCLAGDSGSQPPTHLEEIDSNPAAQLASE